MWVEELNESQVSFRGTYNLKSRITTLEILVLFECETSIMDADQRTHLFSTFSYLFHFSPTMNMRLRRWRFFWLTFYPLKQEKRKRNKWFFFLLNG